jgi:hypothetical protein
MSSLAGRGDEGADEEPPPELKVVPPPPAPAPAPVPAHVPHPAPAPSPLPFAGTFEAVVGLVGACSGFASAKGLAGLLGSAMRQTLWLVEVGHRARVSVLLLPAPERNDPGAIDAFSTSFARTVERVLRQLCDITTHSHKWRLCQIHSPRHQPPPHAIHMPI